MQTELTFEKGITLTIEQFNALSELLPQVESVLQAKGINVTRPVYIDSVSGPKGKLAKESSEDEEEVDEDDEELEVKPKATTKSKLDKFKMKGNHEATSDEDG